MRFPLLATSVLLHHFLFGRVRMFMSFISQDIMKIS